MSSRQKRSPELWSRDSRGPRRPRGSRGSRGPRQAIGRALRGALVALGAALPTGSIALADVIDPSLPRAVVVGAPRGAAPSERIDTARTGRARTRLPHPPIELWRRHICGGIEHLPVVDAEDNILIALSSPELIKLGPDGKEVWRARLGAASPVAPPVLTSDGTAVVITAAGQAWGVAPNGAVRFTTALGVRGRDIETAPLPLRDGGLVVASGPTLLELDRDGAVRARTSLEARPGGVDTRVTGALLAAPPGDAQLAGATLFTTEAGSVYSFRPPGAPRKLGSFGGFARKGATLADARTLLAVVDNRRVVALDLPTGTTHVRATAAPFGFFDGPVTLGPASRGGLALVAHQSGLLLGFDAAGNEKLRLALEKPPPAPDAGAPAAPGAGAGVVGGAVGSAMSFFGPVELKPSPPLIVDPAGGVGFARVNGRVGVVSPEGNLALAGERVCSVPIGVVPAGDKRMLLACRDGGVWLYGE
jgi:outer membrane protein assembly factor BamB